MEASLTCYTELILLVFSNVILGQLTTEFYLANVANQFPVSSGRWGNVREGDPSKIVAHVFEGDTLFVQICTDDWLSLEFTNITYSNDGNTDRISVVVDGLYVGQFDTLSQTDWGLLWDKFHGSGYIGRLEMIPPGQHKIAIKIDNSDCYGVELGTVYVKTDKVIRPGFWCGHGYDFSKVKPECTQTTAFQRVPLVPTTSKPVLPDTTVHVGQYSFRSDCLDTKNVRLSFRTSDLAGTSISARQETTFDFRKLAQTEKPSEARFCKSRIWQLGNIDGDNKEFRPIHSGETVTINLSGVTHQETMFPAKILPFVTKTIIIKFDLLTGVNLKGSAFFALGLVNLTKPAEIGLQFYEHDSGNFSDIHYITFTPTRHVMGWNIPDVQRILRNTNNTLRLHFISESNIIMFDFLKMEYYHQNTRKINLALAQTDQWKVRGLRYNYTKGAKVFIDSRPVTSDIEELVMFYKVFPFRHYQNIVRIHSDGHIYLYKPYVVSLMEQEKIFVDISGFVVTTTSDNTVKFTNDLDAIYLNTSSDNVALSFKDGSFLLLKLYADMSQTKVQILKYMIPDHVMTPSLKETIMFTSTHVTNFLAAINEITVDNGITRSVMADLDDYSGGNKYTLRKTSTSNIFYANDILEINFPK